MEFYFIGKTGEECFIVCITEDISVSVKERDSE